MSPNLISGFSPDAKHVVSSSPKNKILPHKLQQLRPESNCSSFAMSSQTVRVGLVAGLCFLAGIICAHAAAGRVVQADARTDANTGGGYYTLEQAKTGEELFAQNCASCHGMNLEGLSGPPLAGDVFKNDVEFNKITASQLFGFITTQMPYDRPGRLTKEQYELIFTYILYRNHYPSGSTPFSSSALEKVKLLPFPKVDDKQTGQNGR